VRRRAFRLSLQIQFNCLCHYFSSCIRLDEIMVLLITTPAAKAAVDEYLRLYVGSEKSEAQQHILERLENTELDGPIEHSDLVVVSKRLVKETQGSNNPTKEWRLDTLLKGTTVYQPPPPPKPEPVSRSFHIMWYIMSVLIIFSVGSIQSLNATTTTTRRAARIRTHDQSSS
jgi:hypothetical protein